MIIPLRVKLLRAIPMLLIACGLMSCGTPTPTTSASMSATWGDGERVAAGQEVTVRDGDDQTVGIWLVYPNRCETDITYNFVPSGTAATLVGEWCQIDQQWYARIAFDEVTRKKHSIQGDNLWLPLAQLQRVEVAP